MANRKQDKLIVNRARRLRLLLAEFGLTLYGFDPGVSASTKDARKSLHFNHTEWTWLEPLLMELREYRTLAGKLSISDPKAWEKNREQVISAMVKASRYTL